MSEVRTELDRIITAIQAAHEKVAEKGGTTAAPYLVSNLASAIDTIPVGGGGVDTSMVTVTPNALVEGFTALDSSGKLIDGANPYELTATDAEVSDQADLLDQAIMALQGKAAGSGGTTETWIFLMEDGTEIEKQVVVS